MKQFYGALIQKIPSLNGVDRGYEVIFPELNGCVFWGQTREEAIANAKVGIQYQAKVLLQADKYNLNKKHKQFVESFKDDSSIILNCDMLDNGKR